MNQKLSIKIIGELEKMPEQSQRALSERCGVSLGSVHYSLKALVEKGYVKAKNFKNVKRKLAYACILTPSGTTLKKELAIAFLKRKKAEYDALKKRSRRWKRIWCSDGIGLRGIARWTRLLARGFSERLRRDCVSVVCKDRL